MFKEFIKYQSLGNHFILLDWYEKPETSVNRIIADADWKELVIKSCEKNFGIGADGVLIIKNNQADELPEMLVFNADGSQAENCLNGIRCVAHYLFTRKGFSHQFLIKVGRGVIACEVDGSADEPTRVSVITNVGKALYESKASIQVQDKTFEGHVTNIGNPHFVIEQQISAKELHEYGKALESHPHFPNKTNVEFFWHDATPTAPGKPLKIFMLPFERGSGLTLACSTGAAVLLVILHRTDVIKPDQLVTCIMPGGPVVGWLDEYGSIFLQAQAHYVFSGCLP